MQLALEQALSCAESGDVPVGAVIVPSATALQGEAASQPTGVTAVGRNERERSCDPTAHAEVLAIRAAGRALGGWRLRGQTLVVTLEPCAMCAGALVLARIDRVVFGALDPKAGAVSSVWDLVRDRRLNHRPEVEGGVLARECGEVLTSFFAARRLR